MTSITRTFGAALFLGAMLLFLLEPAFGRLVLPRLGGAPAVWNTCLVFFQLTLLAGYLYAWASARWLGARAQVGLHAVLAVAALSVLPIRILPGWAPPADSTPIPWLLGVLGASIGLPFLVVSTTAPVLQHWFSRTDHPDADDPYFLYQASNLGSMAGLIAYPLAVEPYLGLRAQGLAWSVGYVLFVGLVAVCALWAARRPRPAAGRAEPAAPATRAGRTGRASRPSQTPAAAVPAPVAAPGWRQLAWWVLLAAVPSSLLLGVTTTLSTDVAVVPLLWVFPLLLYLATFVVAFARTPRIGLKAATIAHPLIVLPAVVVIALEANEPPWFILPLHLAAFTVMALVCHLRLAEERPHADHLTLFYLCLSIGGAVGGLFNALVAPVVFTVPFEYPLAIIAASLVKPYRDVSADRARFHGLDVLGPVVLGAVVIVLVIAGRSISENFIRVEWLLVIGLPAFVCFTFSARPVRFGLVVAILLLTGLLHAGTFGRASDIERSFFGVHKVFTDTAANLRLLFHGNTMHGVQSQIGRAHV